MRRIHAVIAVVAVAGLALAGWVAPASASSNSLTITTIGREGKSVATTLTVQKLPGATTTYHVASGKALSLPAGTYAITTDIWNTADSTDTIGSKVVKVSGATKATIDARGGVPLSVSLDTSPGSGYTEQFNVQVCADHVGSLTGGYGWPGEFYVLPTTDKDIDLGFSSVWVGPEATSDFYAVTGATTGIPSKPNFTFKTSSLASVNVQARSGPQSGSTVDLAVAPDTGNDCQNVPSENVYDGPAPISVTGHVLAGTWSFGTDTWATEGDSQNVAGYWTKNLKVAAGKSYSQLFYHSAWGPGVTLPNVGNKTLSFDANYMFSDSYATGFDQGVKATTSVSYAGKVIATHTGTNYGDSTTELDAKISATGWYTLTSTATRYYPNFTFPAGMLSPKASVSFHFYLHPSTSATAPGYLTRFVPVGLNLENQAPPNSTSTINLHLDRADQGNTLPAETVKTVAAWYSTDNGTTWHKASTTKVGSYYTAKIPNPASGAVALRSTVTDTKSNTATTTVYRAYAIG